MSGWTDADQARLCDLWNAGITTAEIGHWMGRSKNAIVGRAHRQGLPGRPSPIIRTDGTRTRKARPAAKQTLPPLAIVQRPIKPVDVVPIAKPLPVVRVVSVGAASDRVRCCQWPLGEPRSPGFRLCEASGVALGRTYCPTHDALAWVRRTAASP